MTDPNKTKTLGIRLPDELHTQFVLVAQLDGLSLTDAVRRAVELYVESKRGEADFAERASQALDEIEREAATRRSAIEGLFGRQAQAAEGEGTGESQREGEGQGESGGETTQSRSRKR